MRVLTIAALCFALFAASAQQKGKKPADVQILDTKAVRDAGKISVDGKVRVTGEKSLHGLVIVFDFRSPEKEVVTSQKAVIDEDTLETGREGVFHSEMADSARAVRYTLAGLRWPRKRTPRGQSRTLPRRIASAHSALFTKFLQVDHHLIIRQP